MSTQCEWADTLTRAADVAELEAKHYDAKRTAEYREAAAVARADAAALRELAALLERPRLAIHYVRQEDTNGCGPACLAMVTGRTYREVRDWFRVRAWQNAQRDGRELNEAEREVVEPHDFTRRGIDHFDVERYLAEHGFAVARRFRDPRIGESRSAWPGEPFTDVHMCAIQMVNGTHYVVWLRDGRVLDPATGETTLDDPRYCGVQYILGIVPLARGGV